jgi:predicted DNA binding CopG/RHH family protein
LNIKLRYLTLLLSISGWLFFGALIGKTSAVEGEAPSFTNQDIEKYRQPSDSRNSPAKPAGAEVKRESSAQVQKQKESDVWCRKAASYRKEIERDQNDVKDLEKALDELNDTKGKKKMSIERKLKKAKIRLRDSERDLAELDDEAYRKGIPPGWLRCQFD